MATIYSLIGFGGRTGKSVTTDASTDRVTCAYHGLRNGTAVQFSAGAVPSGGSPSALALNTTYYVRSYNDNEFTLHTSQAGAQANTGQITWTGAGTSLFLKSKIVIDYMTSLAGRWGEVGSERVYDGYASWISGRSGASPYDTEVGEVAESYTDGTTSSVILSIPSAKNVLVTSVNGVRSAAWHGGNFPVTKTLTSGYELTNLNPGGWYGALVRLERYRDVVDGIIVRLTGPNQNTPVELAAPLIEFKNNIVIDGQYQVGIKVFQSLVTVSNNIVVGGFYGIQVEQYILGVSITNNLVTQTGEYGFYGAWSTKGFWYNNIAIGCVINWSNQLTNVEGASNNVGLIGEAPVVGVGASRIVVDANWNGSTPLFMDYANKNFKPYNLAGALNANSTLIVDAGIAPFGIQPSDIADAVRPNYMNGAAEYFDVGPYEFDHGYGLRPVTADVTFSGIISGSEIRIFDSSGTELAGIESCVTDQMLSFISPGVVTIRIVNVSYKIKEFDFTPIAGAQNIPIQLELDKWYSNP